jgi:hypothetical protein
MEMNVEKTRVMKTTRQPSPVQIVIGKKLLKDVEYFNCFASLITVMQNVNVKLNPGLP